MSQALVSTHTHDKISQQELQHLITVSTGFIDAYIIDCYGKEPMLLPQNIVLSALDSDRRVQSVEWHEAMLPVYSVSEPSEKNGVALVIEGDEITQRFALMCNEMPKTVRIRISEVVDADLDVKDAAIFQYVRMGEKIYHIPNMAHIQASIGL
ncbi:hypothetical protein [Acinetobacter wanghuae]|uniref:hypothetical protein n=1 Tax=Acinetobacter wanghuae TaxID=2662362 RepID=UPI003AF43221